ncbi:hypothetical protein IW261DRAFT_892482 [Armillaria novae-zelandiae]|uniref:Uncharacterized protein n=1 Tax=Armillaria novae-zelandiae TaxID=153914 RepID=A0AA39PJ57_9AGAR|nr:hypothetical protein IW261DRAFT_892482 [Armillaria novae-zelandiae]
MSLAQRLNELASANAEGLLDDDEYRLLRQDVFERHARHVSVAATPPSVALPARSIPKQSPPPPSKASVSFSVAGLFRRASRKPPKDVPTASSSSPLKRAFIPRMLSRKQSVDLTPSNNAFSISLHKAPPHSPTRSTHSKRILTPPSHTQADTSINDDIFEDGGLTTTKALRQFIKELEIERQRVLKAFDDLENSAAERQKPANTPPTHNKVPSSSMLLPEGHIANQPSNDAVWSISRSKSFSQKSSGPNSIRRKGSVSSVSSQGTSLLSVNRPTLSSHTSLSRSSAHLPLGIRSSETVGLEDDMTAIQRRRLQVTHRYDARLEYLRARLKGAELHEKLLKK